MHLLIALLLVSAPTWPALAHAQLRGSEPAAGAALQAAPHRVTLRFSEAVEPAFSHLTLYDAQGQALDELKLDAGADGLQLLAPLPALKEGSYALAWQVTSAVDGHVTRGVIPFALGAASVARPGVPGPATSPLPWGRAVVRWLAFAGLFLWLGAVGFALRVVRLAGTAPLQAAARRRLWRLLRLGAALALLGELGDFLYQAVAVQGLSAVGTLLGVRYSRLAALRLGAAALTLALSVGPPRRWRWNATGGLAGSFALARALSGHAAALAAGAAWAVTVDALHLLALGLWLGGLVALLWLWPTVRAETPQQRLAAWGAWLPRFSGLALAAVVVTFASGLYLAWLHLPSWSALWTSAYGRALLAKHALLLPLLALAALNRTRHLPALGRARGADQQAVRQAGRRALSRLRHTVWGESSLAGVILLAGALLTLSAPPLPTPEPFVAERIVTYQETPVRVRLTLAPPAVGLGRVEVELADAQGNPLKPQRVRLILEPPAPAELGSTRLTLSKTAPGRYAFAGVLFGLPGRWTARVQARFRGQAQDLELEFPLEVPGG